jgi:phytoene synthase
MDVRPGERNQERNPDAAGRAGGADDEGGWLAAGSQSLDRAEPDRFLSALLAPPEARRRLIAFYAFAHVLSRVPSQVSEPMLGEIRLQWWREALDRLAGGHVDAHPVLEGLHESGALTAIGPDCLGALVEGWSAGLYPEELTREGAYEAYRRATGGGAMRAALRAAAGGPAEDTLEDWAMRAGTVHGVWRDLAALPLSLAEGQPSLPLESLIGYSASSFWLRADDPSPTLALASFCAQWASEAERLRRAQPKRGRGLPGLMPFRIARAELRRQSTCLKRGAKSQRSSRPDVDNERAHRHAELACLHSPSRLRMQALLAQAAFWRRV